MDSLFPGELEPAPQRALWSIDSSSREESLKSEIFRESQLEKGRETTRSFGMPGKLTHAEALAEGELSVSIHPYLSDEEVESGEKNSRLETGIAAVNEPPEWIPIARARP